MVPYDMKDAIHAVTHEEVTKHELGGAMTHNATSGVAHFVARDDADCLARIRELVGFLPSNNVEDPPRRESRDPWDRACESLNALVPEDPMVPYDMKDAIHAVADDNYFFEVHEHFAQNIVVGFARLEGRPVGIVANQPVFRRDYQARREAVVCVCRSDGAENHGDYAQGLRRGVLRDGVETHPHGHQLRVADSGNRGDGAGGRGQYCVQARAGQDAGDRARGAAQTENC
jgi:acetyl-CoA carboxylase carboxyltransferase component